MKTDCPNCLHLFDVPDDATGKKVVCTKCKQPFFIREFVPHLPEPKPPDLNDSIEDLLTVTRSIRKIMLFFFWLVIIALILSLFAWDDISSSLRHF